MTDFKLIAIRPLTNCAGNYRKVLKENLVYQFYNNYEFVYEADDTNKPVVKVNYTPTMSNELYLLKASPNLQINISAIVGKNGAGKSTLLELFFAAIYLLAVENKVLSEPKPETKDAIDLDKMKSGLKMELFYSIVETIYCLRFDNQIITAPAISFSIKSYKKLGENRNEQISLVLDESPLEFDFSLFFYSIAVNYSIYGLNSYVLGNWIHSLFHKNDGYQTPLVINPMREEGGGINIDNEMKLAKSRLLSNILQVDANGLNAHRKITEYQTVKNIRFLLNNAKIENALTINLPDKSKTHVDFETIYANNGGEKSLLEIIYKELLGAEYNSDNNPFKNVKYHKETVRYIIKKLIQIARNYDDYADYFIIEKRTFQEYTPGTTVTNLEPRQYFFYNMEGYLKKLMKDGSHITFKLFQAINYLKNDLLKEDTDNSIAWIQQKVGNADKEVEAFTIDVDVLAKRIEPLAKSTDLIAYIPPSLFDIDLEFEKSNNSKVSEKSWFSDLSSGEQQFIHSVQSILYHLLNVDSVFKQPDEEEKRKEYDSVNIILDEIELYFHPDYQRQFLSSFLQGIDRIGLKRIARINILCSTHSPFILSDIPNTNILRLIEGHPQPFNKNERTFGANIHDMLAKDFFMEETGFMGEWAKHKIEETIRFINGKEYANELLKYDEKLKKPESKELSKEDKEHVAVVKVKSKGLNLGEINEDRKYHEMIIGLIGEDLIKNKLMDMYYDVFKIELQEELARKQILEIAAKSGIDVSFKREN